MIIISNTFTHPAGPAPPPDRLLRAVGASGSQVRRRFLAEACVLGLIGSLLGHRTWLRGRRDRRLVHEGALLRPVRTLDRPAGRGAHRHRPDGHRRHGTVAEGHPGRPTGGAAARRDQRGTRRSPPRARHRLRPAVRRRSRPRTERPGTQRSATGRASPAGRWPGPVGCLLVAMGILFGAPLFIPTVLRGLGALFGIFGPTPKLAATNAVRNPRRASATATALMLACGLDRHPAGGDGDGPEDRPRGGRTQVPRRPDRAEV